MLVLTLFCPSEERSVDDGPVLNNEAWGRPKLADLFTPEFCLKVGDTFINSIKSEDSTPSTTTTVTQWLQRQRNSGGSTPKGVKPAEGSENLTPGDIQGEPEVNNHPENLGLLVTELIEGSRTSK